MPLRLSNASPPLSGPALSGIVSRETSPPEPLCGVPRFAVIAGAQAVHCMRATTPVDDRHTAQRRRVMHVPECAVWMNIRCHVTPRNTGWALNTGRHISREPHPGSMEANHPCNNGRSGAAAKLDSSPSTGHQKERFRPQRNRGMKPRVGGGLACGHTLNYQRLSADSGQRAGPHNWAGRARGQNLMPAWRRFLHAHGSALRSTKVRL